MKRYRVLTLDFDSRATVLKQEIKEDWEPKVKALWRKNKIQIQEGLLSEYGPYGGFEKIRNFVELGAAPWSIIAFHNKFLGQLRRAFVIGAYYPALTATCALGERILNQLIRSLRDDYSSTPEYKKVQGKESFDNWELAIETLVNWDVLLPNVAEACRKLMRLRHRSLHFNPETEDNDRSSALGAIRELSMIIEGQFAGIGAKPWYIPGTKGATFVKKSYESAPFVRKIILPNCRLVGHLHILEIKDDIWRVHDEHEYEEKEITDEEFVELFNNR